MTTLHLIMDAICRALATSGVVRWDGKFVMVSEAQTIELGRQGTAEVIVTIGRVPDPLHMRVDNGLDETDQSHAGQAVKRVTDTVMSCAN